MEGSRLRGFKRRSCLSGLVGISIRERLGVRVSDLVKTLVCNHEARLAGGSLRRVDLSGVTRVCEGLCSGPANVAYIVYKSFSISRLLTRTIPIFKDVRENSRPGEVKPSRFVLPRGAIGCRCPGTGRARAIFSCVHFKRCRPSLHSKLGLGLLGKFVEGELLMVLERRRSLICSPVSTLFCATGPSGVFCVSVGTSMSEGGAREMRRLLSRVVVSVRGHGIDHGRLSAVRGVFVIGGEGCLRRGTASG